jgi:hypothetical protein
MASQPKPTRKRDKFKALFRSKTPPPPVPPEKAFVKSKMLERDIAVLSITYILADNPELKRLVHLIVAIHDKDEDDQVISSIHDPYGYL